MSIETEKELNKIMDEVFDDMQNIQHYAGVAYCMYSEDKSEAKFFQGQYLALKRTRLNIQTRMFGLQIKREEKIK